MINILLKCVNHFQNHLKIAILNENKKMIHFVPRLLNKTSEMLERDTISIPYTAESYKKDLINKKFDSISRHMEIHKYVHRTEMASIINLIDSVHGMHIADVIDTNQILSLISWCNNIIDCLPVDKVKLARSLWLISDMCNFKMSISHYNQLLKLYIRNEYDFSTTELLMHMKCKEIYPNDTTYKICIRYCCMKGNIDKALMLVKDMQKLHFPISESVFNSLILGYSQSGDIMNVNKILDYMKQQKLKLTTETYAALIYTHAKLNNVAKVKEIIQHCNLNNIHFSNINILTVIYILSGNNNINDVHTMFQYLKKRNTILNIEIEIILKLISINHIYLSIKALSCIGLHDEHPQFENILRLILEHVVNNRVLINESIKLCMISKDETVFKKCFLILLYYSLMKNDHLSLPLLRIFKNHYLIKPHYFWPLLLRQAIKYDLQGILDILKIMINDFNILPCIDTITDYVLPYTFEKISHTRDLLIKHNINETMINNAYVLLLLKKRKVTEAAIYMRYFKGEYFYKIIASDLRQSSIFKNDKYNFVKISLNLIESTDPDSTLMLNNKLNNVTFVPMDKQLHDFMIDFPSHKTWLIGVINQLVDNNINLKTETVGRIHEFLHAEITDDVVQVLQNLTK
ncbi:leucine-rich PPR motif-containing protein, mitochondrial isoform X1 [Bombus affinis]|uniref:leucine-rich PPR motif-containing protein, mitochondrial isoform X1 n=2 Tax=Bombus affinis TaxID=309941 RepID=UPI0021B80A84|nr:leucine-rich PPR motif-containing protein, mitochondrial isoform X1 [Bombus affinis]